MTELRCVNGNISMREMQIGYHSALVLRDLMLRQSKIVHLDLSKNLLGDKGVSLLCPAIARSLSLVSLRLGSNEITSPGIAKLFTAL